MTQQEFIQEIAKYCQKYAKQYGFKIVSPAIAQACLESAYGTSYKAKFHNYFGLKFRNNRVKCNNGYFEDGGSEQNPDGSYTPLPSATAWYKFDTMEAGVEGYYQFINITNYARVKTAITPLQYLEEIKAAHYATSKDYVKNVYNVIQKWDLTKYDNFENTNNVVNSELATTPINIKNYTNTHNTTKINNRKIEWIVLHYTAGTRSVLGSAKNTAIYFSATPNQASADFIVDDGEIVQYNPDPLNYYCWAVGGNAYSNKSSSLAKKYYGECKNKNSISIEMCSCKTNIKSLSVADNDWYITDTTVNNAVKLTQYLMKLYNIDINHVIMHHMVTGKQCPQPWCKNEQALTNWYHFLNKVAGTASTGSLVKPQDPPTAAPYIARVTANVLNVRSGPGTNYPIVLQVKKGSAYTIIEEQGTWGRLKSGAGWVSLKYLEKVT